jgi:hypothetical protein
MTDPSPTISATLYDKLNFNFIDDIAPVVGVLRSPFVMAINPLELSIGTPPRARLSHEEPEAGNLHIRVCGSPRQNGSRVHRFRQG